MGRPKTIKPVQLDNPNKYPLNSYTFTKYNTGFDIYCIVNTNDYRIPLMIATGSTDDLFNN